MFKQKQIQLIKMVASQNLTGGHENHNIQDSKDDCVEPHYIVECTMIQTISVFKLYSSADSITIAPVNIS